MMVPLAHFHPICWWFETLHRWSAGKSGRKLLLKTKYWNFSSSNILLSNMFSISSRVNLRNMKNLSQKFHFNFWYFPTMVFHFKTLMLIPEEKLWKSLQSFIKYFASFRNFSEILVASHVFNLLLICASQIWGF